MKRILGGMIIVSSVVVGGCDLSVAPLENKRILGGDPVRGHAIVASGVHGCTACHDVPGIRAPKGIVGPRLDDVRRRSFIAGTLPNRPDILISFLENPPALVPRTGMPNVDLSAEDARDIAAFLYAMDPLNDR